MEWDDDRENIGSQPQEMGLLRDNIVATGDDGGWIEREEKEEEEAGKTKLLQPEGQEGEADEDEFAAVGEDPSCSSSWRLMKCLHWGP